MGRIWMDAGRAGPEATLIVSTKMEVLNAKRVLLLSHTGKGNLGDDATLSAVIQSLRLFSPDVEIQALTLNPDDTRERHGVLAYPIRRPRRSPVSTAGSTVDSPP